MIGACGVSGGLLSEAGSRPSSANARPITPSFHNEKDSNGQQFVDFNPAGEVLAVDKDTDLFLSIPSHFRLHQVQIRGCP